MTELYALTGQLAKLAALADTDDESMSQAIQDTMDGIIGEFEVKAESVVMLSRNIGGDINAIEKEVDRLNELKRIKKNTVNKLSDYPRSQVNTAQQKRQQRSASVKLQPELRGMFFSFQ